MKILNKEIGTMYKVVSSLLGRDCEYYFENQEDFEKVFSHVNIKDSSLVRIEGYVSVLAGELLGKKEYSHLCNDLRVVKFLA